MAPSILENHNIGGDFSPFPSSLKDSQLLKSTGFIDGTWCASDISEKFNVDGKE
jgi:hypothetical protein